MDSREGRRRAGPYPTVDRATFEAVAGEIAAAFPWVDAVYLFGSRARGRTHPGSDADLAVLARTGEEPENRFVAVDKVACFAEDRLRVPVDVVLIRRELSPGLLFDIFRVQTILYAHDWERAQRVACQARAEYRDLLPRLDRIHERVRQRIKELSHALKRT
jgi:predicted nucleotidyltransferase